MSPSDIQEILEIIDEIPITAQNASKLNRALLTLERQLLQSFIAATRSPSKSESELLERIREREKRIK